VTKHKRIRKPTLADLVYQPMIVAHRGFSGKAPENTRAAFTMALDAGVEMIEFDVQMSKDGHIVVIHDHTVDRTTDATGKVTDYTLEELRSLDAGSWFNPAFKAERILTLEEALELITPKALVNIELKSNRIVRKADTRIADRTLDIVKKMKLLDRVLFSAFNHRLVKYLKDKEEDAATGVIFHPVMHLGRLPSTLAKPAGATVFVCSKRDVTRRRVADAHKHNIIIGVYGLETQTDIDTMLDMGIRVLVSDYPDVLVEGLQQYRIRKTSNVT
jgi:glycerophosphoryl diester phosphodiesterase